MLKFVTNLYIYSKMNLQTILFIDDDEIERMKFKRVCSKSDHKLKILEAKNGEDALEKLQEDVPNLIILDLNMPKMNGIEFLKILKSDSIYKYIPIIVMSSSDNHNDLKECYEIGIAGYIIKPLKYDDYNNHILSLLSYWNINQLIS